jgi:glutaredoxin-related protein
MSGLSNFIKNKVIDGIFRGEPFPSIPVLYFALIKDASQGGNEVSDGSYARGQLSTSLESFAGTQAGGSTTASSGTSGMTSNNTLIQYPAPTADWGLIEQVWVYDSLTGGNLLMKGFLVSKKNIGNGDPAPLFQPGAFVFALSDPPT